MGALSRIRKNGLDVTFGVGAFLITALVVGVLLRTTWLADMEYKGDERYMFEESQRIGVTETWPELGMTSGGGLRNPGFSMWTFAILARVFHATDPLALDRGVVFMNVTAFVVFFGAVAFVGGIRERETWLWGIALAAVSPIAIVLHRKIWAQCTLPLFCVFFLIGWLKRNRWEGAIVWGAAGALLGQVHMSGFFFAFGFFVWEAALGWMRKERPKTKWIGWVGGSIVGSIPLVPWVKYVLSGVDKGEGWSWAEASSGRFVKTWLSDGMGLSLDYSLGRSYLDFLRWPLVGEGKDLYPALYMHGATFCAGAVALGAALWMCGRWLASGGSVVNALKGSNEIAFTLGAAFFGFGLAISLSGVHIFRHYLLVTFPLEWVSFSWLAFKATKRPRALLLVMWVAQLGLSATFLDYIHENGGTPGGDYGPAYSRQVGNRGHR